MIIEKIVCDRCKREIKGEGRFYVFLKRLGRRIPFMGGRREVSKEDLDLCKDCWDSLLAWIKGGL